MELSFRRACRKVLASVVPQPLGIIPYEWSLRKIRAQLAEYSCSVWARNSYIFGSFRPFQSDLDLTIFFEREILKEEWVVVRNRLNEVTRWAPWIVDINVYVVHDIPLFLGYANPFELKRDPELRCSIASLPRSEMGLTERALSAAFLMRNLDGELDNLTSRPDSRRSKWDKHFSAVEIASPKTLSVSSVIEASTGLLGLNTEESSHLVAFYEKKAKGEYWTPSAESPESLKVLTGFLPHAISHTSVQGMQVTGALREMMEAQLAWEIWGVYSRTPILMHPIDVHLEVCLRTYLASVSKPNPLIKDGLRNLRAYSVWTH